MADIYLPSQRHGLVAPAPRDLFLAPALLPLQFSSLEFLDQRVSTACEEMASVEGLSPNTIRWVYDAYKVFRRYLKESGAERTFLAGELARQVESLDGWIAHLRARGCSRATINTYWRGMRVLCTRFQRLDGLVNPFAFRLSPNPGEARLRCLTQSAAEHVLTFLHNDASVPAWLRARNSAIAGVMLFAGLRKSEVLRLRVSAVDFDAGVVRVFGAKGRHGGKSRTVPMTSQLVQLLRTYAAARAQITTDAPEFFLGARGAQALSDVTLRRLFERVSRTTGVHVSPHMLRHTFCTLLSKFGVSDRLAREAMGHADYKTLRRYQHVYEAEVAEAMTKFVLNVDLPGDEPRDARRALAT